METVTDEIKEVLSHNKNNVNVMSVGYIIWMLQQNPELMKFWCLLDNQSTFKAFINGQYIPNTRDDPDGKYLRVHCNEGVTYTNKIDDFPGYSNHVWYNSKGISNTL